MLNQIALMIRYIRNINKIIVRGAFPLRFVVSSIFVLAMIAQLYGQYPGEVWYFGASAGIDFKTDPPSPLSDGNVNSIEGCATMCDGAGNLLLYTDGITVWNRNNQIMENGEGLFGHHSSTQTAVIVKQPGTNPNIYIFTTPSFVGAHGFCYSVVDINANNGMGEVILKNQNLLNTVSEKLTVVQHSNGIDFWILGHKYNSDAFYAYLLSSSGLSAAPVVSNAGSAHQGGTFGTYNSMGYLKASPSGEKLALAIYEIGKFELFDFNKTTGTITHQLTMQGYEKSYGVEFSPNGQLLYVKGLYSGKIYQYNLSAGSSGEIINSRKLIGEATSPPTNPNYISGALQLGLDGKIYVAKYMNNYLGRINNPNVIGAGCGFVDDAFHLGGGQSLLGFPFAGKWSLAAIISEFYCFGDTTTFEIVNATNIVSVLWDFGDPASGANNTSALLNPVHVFSAPGNYTVTLSIQYPANQYVTTHQVTI
ncbi:MAG: PKD domain-containing protein, partial [Bacteroidales bacterium]|nr:PKD domain-containing protein [Bacteroidales bacterium]